MRYGVKLSPAELADEQWRAMYGETARLLGRLRGCGLGFAEFTLTEEMPPATIAELGRRAWREGLASAVHPYLYKGLAAEVFDRADPRRFTAMFELADELGRLAGQPAPMVFHGGRATCGPHNRSLDDAAAAARKFFAWAEGQARSTYRNVRVLCETQMPVFPPEDELWARVGDTYESCLELVRGTGVEVCWDFGHSFSSVLLGKHAAFPPAEFLGRVGHVHAHDTVRDGPVVYDHRPLGEGLCPWRRYFGLLAECGFDGGVLFEVDLRRLGGYEGLTEMLKGNIAEINAIFASGRP